MINGPSPETLKAIADAKRTHDTKYLIEAVNSLGQDLTSDILTTLKNVLKNYDTNAVGQLQTYLLECVVHYLDNLPGPIPTNAPRGTVEFKAVKEIFNWFATIHGYAVFTLVTSEILKEREDTPPGGEKHQAK
ncbi:MAG: hypothetical protein D6812_12370 [Deltaproteobacteria bacterium]|nr:MAG: hypothetical protein D6812_12370 [Deltaproteobacteria bacterium]